MSEVERIVAKAEAALEAAGKGAKGLEAARHVFDGALLEWVDEFIDSEPFAGAESGVALGPLPADPEAAAAAIAAMEAERTARLEERAAREESISSLWIEWANMEARFKQWKQANRVFDLVGEVNLFFPKKIVNQY